MKLAFTINPFRTIDEINSFHEVIEKGFYQGIEIFYPNNPNYDNYTKALKELKAKFPNLEFVMHLPYGNNCNLCDIDNYYQHTQLIKDAIFYADQFGVKKHTLHLGKVDLNKNRKFYINHIVKVLKDICEYAKKFKMIIMIENMPGIGELGYAPQEIKEIIELVGVDNLKVILDTGHMNVSEYDMSDYIYLLKDYLLHLHLNDNDGTKDSHTTFGTGNIDFNRFIRLLEEVEYNELFCLEIIYKTKEDLETNAKALLSYKN